MENNNPKKSKAFIITFIIILILLILGYYLFSNKDQIFGTKGTLSVSKIFSPLLGSSKKTDVKVVDDKTTGVDVTPPVAEKLTGTIITDADGNKIVLSEAGEDLKKGDVLYISGFNANKNPIIMKAIAKDKTKSLVFGVAGEDLFKGNIGNVIISGVLTGVPTNKKEGTLWAATNSLYLSDKIYGGMTKNAPALPSSKVLVGSVIKVDKINGSIQIGNLAANINVNSTQLTNLNKLNGELLNSSTNDMRDYWSSVFGINSYVNPNSYTGPGFDYTNPPFNPIVPPSNPDIIITPTTPTNKCQNGATNYPTCTTINGNCINGATNPGLCTISIQNKCNNGATNYPTCTTKAGVCINKATNPDLCTNTNISTGPTITESSCPVDDPLSNYFTDQDKKDLANYLQQFYLIAPTIKTGDDITIAENAIISNTSFAGKDGQLDQLINDCHNQKMSPSYTGPQEVMSNPYYQGPVNDTTYVTATPKVSTQPFSMFEKLLNIW